MGSQEIIQLRLSPLVRLTRSGRVQWAIVIGETPIARLGAVVDICRQITNLGLNAVAVTPPAVGVSSCIVASEGQITGSVGSAGRSIGDLGPVDSSDSSLNFRTVGGRNLPWSRVVGGVEGDGRESTGWDSRSGGRDS